MVFSLSIVQQYLLIKHSIPPEHVLWDTRLRQDLQLNSSDIQGLLGEITQTMTVGISLDTDHHLTDVLDLAVYVLLRSTEELVDLPNFDLGFPTCLPTTSDYVPFSALACRTDTSEDCSSGNKTDSDG